MFRLTKTDFKNQNSLSNLLIQFYKIYNKKFLQPFMGQF